MKEIPIRIKLIKSPSKNSKNAQRGDILISRVGSRCLGRAVYVEEGEFPISDCVIVIRPRTLKVGFEIWNKIKSEECRNYFINTGLGVGAKYITHEIVSNYIINAHETSK